MRAAVLGSKKAIKFLRVKLKILSWRITMGCKSQIYSSFSFKILTEWDTHSNS
jgi:hypothetical protein